MKTSAQKKVYEVLKQKVLCPDRVKLTDIGTSVLSVSKQTMLLFRRINLIITALFLHVLYSEKY